MKHFVFLMIALLLPCAAFTQHSDHRNRQVDSLEQILATNPPSGEALMKSYYDLMWGYMYIDGKKSMEYARKCIEVSVPIDNWEYVAFSFRYLGVQHYLISQYDSAMYYYDKALEATEKMRDFPKMFGERIIDSSLSGTYGSIGNLYNNQGKYHEAIDWYHKALTLFEKYDWKQSQCEAYHNIGEMYRSMGNYRQAEFNFSKYDTIAHLIGDTFYIAKAKYCFSSLYLDTQDYNKALHNAEIAYDYFFSHPEQVWYQLRLLNNLADIVLTGFNDEALAEKYVRQAIQMSDTLDFPHEKTISLRIAATLHLNRGEWRQAIQTALDAIAADESEPANTILLYTILAKSYAHLGNAAKVSEYIDKQNEFQSTWVTKHYQSALSEMEVKYETEKKETQIATLETKNRLLAAEKRLLIGLGIAVTFGLFLFVVALIFRQKSLAMQKKLTEEGVKRLEEQHKLALAEAALEGELAERRRIARDLHDGLGGMLAAVKINMQNVKPGTNGDTNYYDKAFDLLDGSMKELRRLAHHLMPDALMQYGLKTALEIFCQSLPNIRFHYYGEDKRMDGKLETMLYRSAYELIYNAVKHAQATQTNVQLVQEPDRISLTVQDDGKGFDVAQKTKGMGLNNIRERVAAFNGEYNICSEIGNGTEISIELKINS